jgi:hypothetical protein
MGTTSKSQNVRLRTNMYIDLRFIPAGTVMRRGELPERFRKAKYVESVDNGSAQQQTNESVQTVQIPEETEGAKQAEGR